MPTAPADSPLKLRTVGSRREPKQLPKGGLEPMQHASKLFYVPA